MSLKIKQILICCSLYTLFSIGTMSELSAQQTSTTSPR
ncbi:hypothetical protein EZS27_012164, partial [termite gut metagenome]